MSDSVLSRVEPERELAAILRDRCLDVISASDHELASELGLARSGLERLVREPEWDLRTAFRAAVILKLDVTSAMLQVARQSSASLQQAS